MKKRIYEVLKLLLVFLIFFYFSDIIVYLLHFFGVDFNTLSDKMLVLYQFIISLVMFGILFLLYFRVIKKDYFDFKKNLNKNIIYIIKIFFIFMITKYIVSFVSVLIMTLAGVDANSMTSVNQNLIEDYLKVAPILMFLSSAILAPFYEEFLFRLGICRVIKNKYLFIVLSGAIFGLIHVFPLDEGISLSLGIMQSITYVTMGIFLAYVYKRTNNIFMSVGVHFLNNLLSVLTMINML